MKKFTKLCCRFLVSNFRATLSVSGEVVPLSLVSKLLETLALLFTYNTLHEHLSSSNPKSHRNFKPLSKVETWLPLHCSASIKQINVKRCNNAAAPIADHSTHPIMKPKHCTQVRTTYVMKNTSSEKIIEIRSTSKDLLDMLNFRCPISCTNPPRKLLWRHKTARKTGLPVFVRKSIAYK